MIFMPLCASDILAVGDLICHWKDSPDACYDLADTKPVLPNKPCIAVGYGSGEYSVKDVAHYNSRIDIRVFRDVTPPGAVSDYMAFLMEYSKNPGNPELRNHLENNPRLSGYKQTKTGMPLRIPMNPIYSQPLPLP